MQAVTSTVIPVLSSCPVPVVLAPSRRRQRTRVLIPHQQFRSAAAAVTRRCARSNTSSRRSLSVVAMAAEPAMKIGYWGIRGLAAPLRMMAMYAGVKFENVSYDLEATEDGWSPASWLAVKPKLKERNALINLPYIDDNGMLVTQSNACMAYLGRKFGLWGKTEAEVVQCEQLLCELMDLRNKMTAFAYSGQPDAEAVMGAAIKLLMAMSKADGPYTGTFQKLDAWLAANTAGNDTFFVGSSATAPDFHAWEMLDQFTMLAAHVGAPDPLAGFPHLKAFHTRFAELPGNSTYHACALARLPCNNKMAVFGSTPKGPAFVRGKDVTDWHGSSGVY